MIAWAILRDALAGRLKSWSGASASASWSLVWYIAAPMERAGSSALFSKNSASDLIVVLRYFPISICSQVIMKHYVRRAEYV